MPSPEVIDFAKLLAPVPGGKPTGADLRADASPNSPYYVTKDARSAARAAERQIVTGDDAAEAPSPDWRPVYQNATKVLVEKSKDLELTAYLIEALTRLHGFAGLRDGFRLARELVEKYWDGLYPLPDEEGMETRVAPLAGLNGDSAEGTLIAPIARVPLMQGETPFAYHHYQQAAAVAQVADDDVRQRRLEQGAASMELLDRAAGET